MGEKWRFNPYAQEGFGAGDCAKNAGFGLSFWEPASIEPKTGSTKQGEQGSARAEQTKSASQRKGRGP